MHKTLVTAAVTGLAALAIHAATPPATVPVDNTPAQPWKPSTFIVPDGFEIEVVAAPPLVEHPMMGGFDDQGRLYLAEAVGQNLKFDELQKQKPNYVRMLVDTDGDGKFDKTTIFADKLEFPMGAMWHDGAVYVASPPSVWKLIDTDGDGVADKRIELVTKFGSTGNAADVHGCFLTPTGRIAWVDGFHGHDIDQHHQQLKGAASKIFSCKPDGTDIRIHCGGGMDNPTEIDWTREGEMIGDVNILYTGPRVDCLVHWLYGGSYPHRAAAIPEFKITGDLLGPVARFGHAAVAGCIRVRSDAFGKEYQDSFLTCQFNTQRIVRSKLTRSGATFTSQEVEFVRGNNPDMHITDVIEDADGSLLIVDTGGWFRIGCPTSQIAKPNILGGVYRLKKKGAPKIEDPRGLKIAFDTLEPAKLTALLDDPRWVVREKAIAAIAKRGDAAVAETAAVLKSGSEEARRNAVWSLSRIQTKDAGAKLVSALADASPSVRQSAAHALADSSDPAALPALTKMVVSDEPPVRREAAVALGRLKKPEAVPALFAAMESPVDRTLDHSLIFALIEIDHADAVAPGLTSSSPAVRRAALLALDQMDHPRISPELVLEQIKSADPSLRSTAASILARHTDWVDAVNRQLAQWLAGKLEPGIAEDVQKVLAAFLPSDSTRALVGSALASRSIDRSTQGVVLAALAAAPGTPLHDSWVAPLNDLLHASDDALVTATIQAVAQIKTDKFKDSLKAIGSDTHRPPLVRIAALRAVGGKSGPLEPAAFELLLSQIEVNAPLNNKLEAARVLADAKLTDAQQLAIAPHVATAGPLELPTLLLTFKSYKSEVGKALVANLDKSPGLVSVPISQVKTVLGRFKDDVKDAAAPMMQRLYDQENQKLARMAELEPYLAAGDPARGKVLFDTAKGTCIACHTIKGTGGKVGPDLSQIGRSRQPRDLLESVVVPSASFARGYEPWVVNLTDGTTLMGTIPTDSPDAITFMQVTGVPMQIPRKSIKSMAMSSVSIMPVGLDRTMTPQELADLIAYLKSLQ